MIKVNLPDGRVVSVDTDDPNIAAQAAQKFMSEPSRPEAVTADATSGLGDTVLGGEVASTGDGGNVLRSFLGQGVALGFGDEIEAFVRSKINGTSFDDEVTKVRSELKDFEGRNPGSAMGLELAGAFSTALIPGAGVARGATAGAQIGRGAAAGAGIGGVSGFATGEGGSDRLQRAATGAALGAPLGAVAPAVASKFGKSAGVALPRINQLRDASRVLFKKVEDAGVVIPKPDFDKLIDDIVVSAKKVDKDIHPNAFAALKRLVERKAQGGDVPFEDFATLREIAKDASLAIEKKDARLAGEMVDRLDDFFDGFAPNKGGNDLRAARELWRRYRNSQEIAERIRRAELSQANFSGSGLENAIRTEFRNLAKNKKLLRTFKKSEVKAIERVAKGGAFENVARTVGKAAPTGVVSLGIGSGAGFAAGGPIGAVALPMIGFGGRGLATQLTRSNVDAASALIRAGVRPPRPRLTGAQAATGLGAAGATPSR